MAEHNKMKVAFTCLNPQCKHDNEVEISVGTPAEGATSLVRRCVICGVENKIDLPEGYIAEWNATVDKSEPT